MKHYWKNTIKQLLHKGMIMIKNWKYFQFLKRLPFLIRVAISGFLFLYGVIAALSPLPFGILSILLSGSLILGIRRIKTYILRLFSYIRLYKILGFLHMLWYKKK